jgi:hypothetical protein
VNPWHTPSPMLVEESFVMDMVFIAAIYYSRASSRCPGMTLNTPIRALQPVQQIQTTCLPKDNERSNAEQIKQKQHSARWIHYFMMRRQSAWESRVRGVDKGR